MEHSNSLIITLSDTKTNRKRVFSVAAEGEAVNPFELYHKYARLRPQSVPHDYFFLSYRKQKCTVQRVGVHYFGKMPGVVAEYLRLPNPELYTGHCFRRTSATLVADAGAELVTLKRLGGWRSSSVAESYIEDSLEKKRKVSTLIMGEKEVSASTFTSTSSCNTAYASNTKETTEGGFSFCGNNFKYAKNCNFHFHVAK